MVIATQNNLYASGTFPLPEPQLDRFVLSVTMALPPPEVQAGILRYHADLKGANGNPPPAILNAGEITQAQGEVREISVHDRICDYITQLCETVRKQKGAAHAVSSRAAIAVLHAAQAAAYLENQPAVYPDDVKRVFPSALRHRLSGADLRESTPVSASAAIDEALRSTPVP